MKRISLCMALMLIFSCACAEFYTSNPDPYYHQKMDCVAGSTYEISQTAALQFEKIACPACVERTSVRGEIMELALPEGDLNLQDADFKNGRLLLCGFVNLQRNKPWMAVYDVSGKLVEEYLGDDSDDIFRDARYLSDGNIALLRSSGEKWRVDILDGGKNIARSEDADYLAGLWATEDGFIVHGWHGVREYMLAECGLDKKIQWTLPLDFLSAQDDQPALDGVLLGEDVNIVYGRHFNPGMETSRSVIAAFDGDGKLIGKKEVSRVIGSYTEILYDENNHSVGYQEADSFIPAFNSAAWTDGGVIFIGIGMRPGFAVKYGENGEEWFADLALLNGEDGRVTVDGARVETLSVRQILRHDDNYLLLMDADSHSHYIHDPAQRPASAGNYVRIVRLNGAGRIISDWFEDVGEIVEMEDMFLFAHGEDVYLLAYGLTMDSITAYEKGMTQPQIPEKMLLKKIAA